MSYFLFQLSNNFKELKRRLGSSIYLWLLLLVLHSWYPKSMGGEELQRGWEDFYWVTLYAGLEQSSENTKRKNTGQPTWSSKMYIGTLTNSLWSMKSDRGLLTQPRGRFCPAGHFRGVTLKFHCQSLEDSLAAARGTIHSRRSPPTGHGDHGIPREPGLRHWKEDKKQKKLQTACKLPGDLINCFN